MFKMVKQFRLIHYPLFFIIIVVFIFVSLNTIFRKDSYSLKLADDRGFSRVYSEGDVSRVIEIDFNNNNALKSWRNPFSTEFLVGDNMKQVQNKGKSLFPGLRFVHLDLKGAPPKISYLMKIFPIIAKLGANGLLIEYEDMFPYGGGNYAAANAYTKADISNLLKAAKDNNLEVIPLLQTFGHAEFVLKLKEYKHLREDPSDPRVYCPSRNGTMRLLEKLIDSVLDSHPDSRYFHIGCDEVYQLGLCSRCLQVMENNNWTKRQLFLNHVRTVAEYVKTNYPKFQVLIWDDELRKLTLDELLQSELGNLVEPVVWKYQAYITSPPADLPPTLWLKYSKIFKNVWIASAFKGADTSDAVALDLELYTSNHEFWMDTVESNSMSVNFFGIILTGWQRYDHFAVLCELFPVGFPSLAVNLAYITGSDKAIYPAVRRVGDLLNCVRPLSYIPTDGLTHHCKFPGAGVYEAISLLPDILKEIRSLKKTSVFRGWFKKYNIDRRFSNPVLLKEGTERLNQINNDLTSLEVEIVEKMDEVYDKYTVEEWLSTHLRPHQDEIKNLLQARSDLLYVDEWPRRPLVESKVASSSND